MSFSDDIRIIALGSMGSEVATIIGRYQREGEEGTRLTEDEKNVLAKAIKFVQNMREGHQAVEARNFNMSAEVPGSYNYYLRVRQQLQELGPVKESSDLEKEIAMFADALKKLNEERKLNTGTRQKLGNVGKFFSRLSEVALEELNLINNVKSETELI